MADRWWGYIEIDNVPAAWLRADAQRDAIFGCDVAEVLNRDAIPAKVWRALEYLGHMDEIDFEPYAADLGTNAGTLKLSDGELAGGSYRFQEDGLTDALMEAGLPFEGGDDGRYEFPGTRFWWRPGMDAMEERTAAADTGIVLSERELRDMVAATTGREDLLARMRDHFDLKTDDDLQPRKVNS